MKYLFFSPYGIIQDWRFSEYLIQKSLSKSSEITILGCKSIMKNSCIAIKAHSDYYQNNYLKEKICKRCIKNQKNYSKKFKNILIEDFIDKSADKKINNILKDINIENFLDFKMDNFKLGKISLFENMLIFKKNDINFSNKEFLIIKNSIKTLLYLLFSLKNLNKKFIPDVVISQNGNYSTSKLFNEYFYNQKIPSYSWEATNHYHDRFNKLFLSKSDNNFGLNYIKNNWKNNFKNKKLSKENLLSVNKHIETIVKAKALRSFSKNYSKTEKTIREFYNIDNNKIILLNTSSWDEIVGTYLLKNKSTSELLLFEDQEEWIKKTVNFFKDKNDCALIIRPHPRDYDNKNSKIKKILNNINLDNKNIYINKPEDKVSLYSVFKDTNLVLNSWSTLGMEAGIFNIPVLSISKELLLYPNEIEYSICDKSNYFNKISDFLNQNNKSFDIARCKNYYNFLTNYLDHSSLKLNISRNKYLYFTSKFIDKITLPIISTSLRTFLNGKSLSLDKNNELLSNYFSNNLSVINELDIHSDSNEATNEDYLRSFHKLCSLITTENENNIISSKMNYVKSLIKS